MNDRTPKRKVNPMLLLGTEGEQKKEETPKNSQPALIETGNFDKSSPARRSFPVTSSKGKALPGENKESARNVSVGKDNANDSVDEVSLTDGAKVKPSDPSLSSAAPVKKAVRTPVSGFNPFPRSIPSAPPTSAPAAPLAPPEASSGVFSKIVSEPSRDIKKDEKVSPTGDKKVSGPLEANPSVKVPKNILDAEEKATAIPEVFKGEVVGEKPAGRRVNPMFLAGEEKEYTETEASRKGNDRVLRPNFILKGDSVPVPRLPKRDVGDNASKLFKTLPAGEAKPRSQYARKIESNVDVEDWTDDKSTDTSFGLGGELDVDFVEPQYSKAFHLTDRDLMMMRFLARYRYAYTDQLARLVDTMPKTIVARLRVLEKRGFVRRQPITDRQYLWVTRKAGNLLVDINFPEIRKGSLSYATIAHTIGIANLGVEFEREAGGKDLLGENKGFETDEMPKNRFKFGIWGNPEGKTFGEMTVTEREVRQGQLRWRGGRDSKEMRSLVDLAAKNVDPVELEEGQEGLFVIYGQGGKGGEHIPDLVVARERDADGKPQHIAIELELTPKTPADWKKILRNYRDNGDMYSKVYYFTHKRSISTGIQKADQEVGLGDRLVVRKYLPTNNAIPFWG